jgi:Protein adenylyltransferase SelO
MHRHRHPAQTPPRYIALLALALLALLPSTSHSQLAPMGQGSTFDKALSSKVQDKLLVKVPLVALDKARVVMANHERLAAVGIKTPQGGLHTSTFEREVLGSFAFRQATDEEIKAGKFTHTGIATRYADKLSNGVKGDGRAVLMGDVVVKDRRGRITGIYDIQVKGIGTGLHPNWKGYGHRHGREVLRQAVEDALFSDYLTRNGIRTNNWLAVIDSGETINFPDGGKQRAGLLVRGGNFMRLAHLNLLRNDVKGLREVVDFVNKQASVELGRKRPLSIPGLYKVLCQRKAREVADMYWIRTVHGSTTYDNIGLFDNMDHGTGSTVDRTHKNYSFFSKWVGYGGEPKFVMRDYYEKELYNLLMKSATPAEQKQLKRLKPGTITSAMVDRQMTYRALLSVGFTDKDALKVLHKQRGEAKTFLKTFTRLANVQETGATHKMGKDGRTEVKDPARYDMFAAMSKLAELQVTRRSVEARAKALTSVLRPGAAATEADRKAARDLVTAFDKLAQPFFSRGSRREAVGRARLMRDNARSRNHHALDTVRRDMRSYADGITQRIVKGESLETIRASLSAYMRNNVVLGNGSSVHAASRLLSGKAARTSDKRVILSQHRENGVVIQEVSDGSKDAIRVKVKGNPLGLGDLWGYRMHYSVGGKWRDIKPLKVDGKQAIFEVPLVNGKVPASFAAAFFNGNDQQGRWWNNGGRSFGKNIKLVLGAANVQAALGVEAQRRGGRRQGLRSSLRAVSEALFRAEPRSRTKPQRTTPRHQRSLLQTHERGGAAGVRTFSLTPRRERTSSPTKTKASKGQAAPFWTGAGNAPRGQTRSNNHRRKHSGGKRR